MRTREQKKKDLQRLIRNWEKYRQLVIGALTESKVTPRTEKQFLQLKAALAEQIQVVEGSVPRSIAYESKQHLEAMAELVKRHVTLTTKDMGAAWQREDFENTWHQYFIFLNRLRGMELGNENPHPYEASDADEESTGSRLWSAVGWTVAFAALALLLYVVASAAGLSLGGADGLSLSVPQTLGSAVQNASNAFGSLGAGLSVLIEPVVSAYGVIWSLAMAGALVVLLGLFVVLRV
jgi:hypothetical protein